MEAPTSPLLLINIPKIKWRRDGNVRVLYLKTPDISWVKIRLMYCTFDLSLYDAIYIVKDKIVYPVNLKFLDATQLHYERGAIEGYARESPEKARLIECISHLQREVEDRDRRSRSIFEDPPECAIL